MPSRYRWTVALLVASVTVSITSMLLVSGMSMILLALRVRSRAAA